MDMSGTRGQIATRISRRWFIGGLASLGAFEGCRFLPGGFGRAGEPNLRLGVVSDIHVAREGLQENLLWAGNARTFRHTLEWFRDQRVDGVVIAGDLADNGVVEQLEVVAKVWNDVFPNDRAPDGRKVERLFVCGNHDMAGMAYAGALLKDRSEAERNRSLILADPKAAWERAFHEAYAPIWRKTVRGYSFVGAHWLTNGAGTSHHSNPGVRDFYAAHAREFDPDLPFFHIQHPHLKDTCFGPWAWGHDEGAATAALSAFPNAIAFSGHAHYSLTDERTVWQGAFTSVGASSLMYGDLGWDEFPNEGFENSRTSGDCNAWRVNARKMMGYFNGGDSRQGMLWSVYDDCIVVRRRDFLADLDLGPELTLPLPAAEAKPFAFATRAKSFPVPEFADGARLRVERIRASNRGGRIWSLQTPIDEVRKEQDALRVTIPAIAADASSARVYYYEIESSASGRTMRKRITAEGYNRAPGSPKTRQPTVCVFACAELPAPDAPLSVFPVNCYGRRGKPLVSEVPQKLEEVKG